MNDNVLVVGGDAALLGPLKEALKAEPYEISMVGDPSTAWVTLSEKNSRVVISNDELPQSRGVDFLLEVQKKYPKAIRVLLTTGEDRKSLIDAVNDAEVYRFLTPPLTPGQTARVLRDALNIARIAEAQEAVWTAARLQQDALEQLMSPSRGMTPHGLIAGMTGTLATAPARHAPSDSIGVLPQEQAGKLSTREQEIVAALGSGQRVKEIAQELVISTHTVRNHLKAIYRKLNVSSQFELISMLARGTRHVEPHSIM